MTESFLVPNHFFQAASPRTAAEEANFLCSYRTALSQLRSSLYSSLYFYGERIGLIPSSLCCFCGLEPHTFIHIFTCSSNPAPLTERDLRKRRRSSCLVTFSYDLLPFPPPKQGHRLKKFPGWGWGARFQIFI